MPEPTTAKEDSKPYEAPKGVTQTLRWSPPRQTPFPYTAQADWIVLRKRDKPLADVFHVFYRRTDDARPRRPVTFVFNGGPGASSAYLHMGALGPTRVAFQPDGGLLPPPVRLVDNEQSWLQFSDLVFVDPVGTGFSRAVDKPAADAKADDKETENKEFFGLNRDLESLGEFISSFLSRHGLWSRPVFIAGESYGGFRVAKLSRKLQEGYGVGLNGAIMISPALEIALLNGSDYDILMWADVFPSYVLAAVHHGRCRMFDSKTPTDEVRRAAEQFALSELVSMLAQGEYLAESERNSRLLHMADFLGLPAEFVAARGGRISQAAFTRELLRDQRLVCGLYDATATAIDPFPDRSSYAGADPTLSAIERVFNGAINVQLREVLKVDSERDYRLLNLEVNEMWKNDSKVHSLELQIGATDDLRYAMGLNADMAVFIAHGLYDLVTPYFSSERLTHLMKLHPAQRSRITLRNYQGGHMFYSWDPSRVSFYQDIEAFQRAAVPS